ncbi:uncharacterized protein gprin1 [Aplochiton taeniatus]
MRGLDSPAPASRQQQHIHTQVSLEVVQCHSVATSPMTPPEGGATGTFFFPSSCGIHDADMQAGRQVEYRSVATAPMTPRTPTTPAGFLTKIASERKQEQTETKESCNETERAVEPGLGPGGGDPPLELTPVLKHPPSKEVVQVTAFTLTSSQESFTDCPKTDTKGLCYSKATVGDDKQPSKQHGQRMGSMEQDITILVTHYHGPGAEDGEGGEDEVETSIHFTQPEMAKIDEYEEPDWRAATSEVSEETTGGESEKVQAAGVSQTSATGTSEEVSLVDSADNTKSKDPSPAVIKNVRTDADDLSSKSSQNEKPELSGEGKQSEKQPFGGSEDPGEHTPSPASRQQQQIHTQVSLEVVQCHSVATSPMTPPQGGDGGTFFFPSSGVGRKKDAETKDAEMQAGSMVEYRHVATAPMTPRTPTSPSSFPEFTGRDRYQAGKKIEEKLVEESEEEGEKREQRTPQGTMEEVPEKKEEKQTGEKEPEKRKEEPSAERTTLPKEDISEVVPQIKEERKTTEKEDQVKQKETSAVEEDRVKAGETKKVKPNGVTEETTAEEPVQEVRWDEKGMTWEVYGAVVEVAVLGTAIQKHLEKQVKKQKKDPASILPPPPPLSPSAVPLPSTPPPPASGCSQRGSGKGRARKKSEGKRGRRSRRNPFRLLLQNIQQPHCCARAHSTE